MRWGMSGCEGNGRSEGGRELVFSVGIRGGFAGRKG